MPAKGGYTNARERAKSQTFAKDLKDTASAVGYVLGRGLAGKAADAFKQKRMQDGQTTDSNNR